MTITQATLDKLAKYDTPTICNVIELFDIRPRNAGYMDHRVQSNFPELQPMVGFACTAQFRSDAPPVGGDAYGSIGKQLEAFGEMPGPAVVVFQDADDPPVSAVFGEVMCSTYQAYGSAGLVTNGGGRRSGAGTRVEVSSLHWLDDLLTPLTATCCILAFLCVIGGLMVYSKRFATWRCEWSDEHPARDRGRNSRYFGRFYCRRSNLCSTMSKLLGDKTVAKFNELREEFQAVVAKLKEASRKTEQ